MYKIINILYHNFFCYILAQSMQTAKKALTGEEEFATDEFMVKKKNPLILPPDYENLPTPDEEACCSRKKFQILKKLWRLQLKIIHLQSSSAEESILKKIRSK